ncbi:SRPBCC domain-containing protein [Natrinema longum]|uniref:SRPBCC domain-containing protein n=1 Tax=Natrinema longum TaxID=370324 RepID=A0A8A2U974_9EURY|nr:SRPBCC domain-containing protein [Natrinema longum]MBZ6493406.1 SRPBCC domain-containing protein [Natrinema longum]QSW85246.1 SRPBCC domain-containing protein [Natrinema longum]
MKQVEVFAEIDAPPAVVWEALLSFDTYPEWDPIEGTITGVAIDATTPRRGADASDFGRLLDGPIAITVEPTRRLAWLDRLAVPFAFDRYHEFHLDPIDGERPASDARDDDGRRTRLLQRETVRGAFVPFTFDEARVERAFVRMNEAIAARAERLASAPA